MDQQISPSWKEFEDFLSNCDDPINAWDSKLAKKALMDENVNWILSIADWSKMLTFTFRDEKYPDVAMSYFKRLIRALNREVFGKSYTKIVGHSYFSYALGIERQTRGVIHFHMIVDRPIHFGKVHALWNEWAGFAWIDNINVKLNCVKYIAKYNLKGGNNEVYLAKKQYLPKIIPSWWIEDQVNQFNLFGNHPG